MGTTVRRNLFHHHLSRRPVSAAPNPLGHGGNNDTRQLRVEKPTSSDAAAASPLASGSADNDDIVVKDKNGGYELDVPALAPTLANNDCDEMNGVGEAGTSGADVPGTTSATDSAGDTDISGREKEKIEASLMEMMGRNRNRRLSSEPAEILNLIHQSLQNKVASLEEDNWMYEPENEPRP